MSIKNKKIYVLGGSGTIGLPVTKFLKDNGAKVINLDINNSNNDIIFEKIDVAELEDIEKKLLEITEKHGDPDVFINCSYPKTDEWAELTFKTSNLTNFKTNLDLHLLSYIWISNLFAQQMVRKNTNGSIILTSSIYGTIPQKQNLYEGTNLSKNIAYPVIKAGINQHCKQMASFYGKNNIRVNTVSPGGLEGKIAGKELQQDEAFKEKYISRTPMKRMCKPSDLVQTYLFLSSNDSSYITGQDFIVDGGFSLN